MNNPPNIRFVRIPSGHLAVQCLDVAAVRWVLKSRPDPRKVPVILKNELAEQIRKTRL